MTTEPKNELLPCPFCGGEAHAWERHDQGYSVYGRFWWNVGCKSCLFEMNDREEFKDGLLVHPEKECFTRWNTRPAKAEDSDRGKVDDINLVRKCLIQIECGTGSACIREHAALDRLESALSSPAPCVDVEQHGYAALTPESEGIAGKVDALEALAEIERLKEDDIEDFIARIRKTLNAPTLSTLARPQEIDVEQLKREVCEKLSYRGDTSKGKVITSMVIDALAALGRLK